MEKKSKYTPQFFNSSCELLEAALVLMGVDIESNLGNALKELGKLDLICGGLNHEEIFTKNKLKHKSTKARLAGIRGHFNTENQISCVFKDEEDEAVFVNTTKDYLALTQLIVRNQAMLDIQPSVIINQNKYFIKISRLVEWAILQKIPCNSELKIEFVTSKTGESAVNDKKINRHPLTGPWIIQAENVRDEMMDEAKAAQLSQDAFAKKIAKRLTEDGVRSATGNVSAELVKKLVLRGQYNKPVVKKTNSTRKNSKS